MSATNTFEPGKILLCFIDKLSKGPKTIWSSPAQTHFPFFYGTPKLPFNHYSDIKSILQSRTCVSAINTFEPGWFLLGFIDNCPGDPKQFDPARLRPIPIFYGTPNFLVIIIQTLNLFLNLEPARSATNTFWAGLRSLIGFHWWESRGPKTIRSSPGSDPFPFSMGRQTSL